MVDGKIAFSMLTRILIFHIYIALFWCYIFFQKMLGKVFFDIKKECLHQFFATSVTLHDSTSEIATLKMESEYAVFFVSSFVKNSEHDVVLHFSLF